jgi:Uma2 family endonuclease
MGHPAARLLTYPEYLALERDLDVRHEYLDGQVVAMAGGTLEHSALCLAVAGELRTRMGRGPCRPFESNARVRVLATGLATYPDVSVVCGPPQRDPQDADAIANPTVLVEVLSPSTAAWDRGEKWWHYKQIPSLREYVLVSSDRERIEVFRRSDADAWIWLDHGPGDAVTLASVDVTLDVDAVYEHWRALRAGT